MSSKGLRFLGWGLLSAGGIYGFSHAPLSNGAIFLAALIAWIALAAWLKQDALVHRVTLVHDWPWLMTVGWPVSYVWYARRTQRSWGKCTVLAGLPTAFFLGDAVARIVKALFQ